MFLNTVQKKIRTSIYTPSWSLADTGFKLHANSAGKIMRPMRGVGAGQRINATEFLRRSSSFYTDKKGWQISRCLAGTWEFACSIDISSLHGL